MSASILAQIKDNPHDGVKLKFSESLLILLREFHRLMMPLVKILIKFVTKLIVCKSRVKAILK